MTGIPYDELNSLISLKADLEFLIANGECRCWRCELSPAQIDEWDLEDWDEFEGEFESRWQSGSYYYKASDFTTQPHGKKTWLS